ncbi:MAG: hypothetical protein GXC78_13090 [Chitinophagaceae bacterium]|jgi:hypothetical protein|nr:hypothetical protein [Chitinophagaceae bacterium]
MNLFGEELKKGVLWMKNNPEEVKSLYGLFKQDDQYFEQKFGYYVKRKWINILREFEWYKNADLFRQEGFHCDYKDFLKSPLQLSKANLKRL